MPRQPPVTPYASRGTDVPLSADLPPATWRTAAAAAWLLVLLAAIGYAAGRLYDDQRALAASLRDLAAGRVSVPAVVVATAASAGPVAFAVVAGMVAAAVLYDVPVNRLAWLAAAPAAVGCWSAVMLVRSVVIYGGSGPGEITGLAAAIATQCGLAFAGTRVGRPVARWLARKLLPPPLRVALVALWV